MIDCISIYLRCENFVFKKTKKPGNRKPRRESAYDLLNCSCWKDRPLSIDLKVIYVVHQIYAYLKIPLGYC